MSIDLADQPQSSELGTLKAHVHPVILAGGAGRRLWPLSRTRFPKQFLELVDHTSLLVATINHARSLFAQLFTDEQDVQTQTSTEPPVILQIQTTSDLITQVKAHLLSHDALTNDCELHAEPVQRNTAFALAFASLKALENDEDALMVFLPSDYIFDGEAEEALIEPMSDALFAAHQGYLVSLASKPITASTQYSYISAGNGLFNADGVYEMSGLVLNPDTTQARELIDEGALWQSEIIIGKARSFLNAIATAHENGTLIIEAAQQGLAGGHLAARDVPELNFLADIFAHVPQAAVAPINHELNDLRSFAGLDDYLEPDWENNRFAANVVDLATSDTTVLAQDNRLICTVGLEDLLVIDTPDALLLADKTALSHLDDLVHEVEQTNPRLLDIASHETHAWGGWQTISTEGQTWVRRVTINPGKSTLAKVLSGRTKHWTVIQGSATLMLDGTKQVAAVGETLSAGAGQEYQLVNHSTDTSALLIEVSTPCEDEE